MRAIQSLRYNLEHGGIPAVLRKAVHRAARVAYRSEQWVFLTFALTEPEDTQTPPRLGTAWLDMQDLLTWRFFKAVYYPEDMRARFRSGDLCLGVFVDENLAHVAWMAQDRLPLDPGLPVLAAAEAGGVYDMFTLPEFRRRGCQSIAIETLARRARAEGSRQLVTVVHPGNQASLSVFARHGFQKVGRLSYRKVSWKKRLLLIEEGGRSYVPPTLS